MKIEVGDTKFLTKWLESKVRQAKELVEREIEKIPIQAQNNYDKFIIEVPADDPYVDVYSRIDKTKDKTTLTVDCRGTQVLFIEFGAGKTFYTESELLLYKNEIPKIRPRPPQIKSIGGYGSGRGADDYWAYKSQTGRESENAHLLRYNQNGEPIMITQGNRPSRSLYRAVGMAMRRIRQQLGQGKTKRIAPPPMN